jgi:hypothetical protein
MDSTRRWKREYDAIVARSCNGTNVSVIWASSLQIENAYDDGGQPIADFSADELACRQALTAARGKGLIQAWSLAEGPQGFAAMVVRFDGAAARNIETTPAKAMCWLLLEISPARN